MANNWKGTIQVGKKKYTVVAAYPFQHSEIQADDVKLPTVCLSPGLFCKSEWMGWPINAIADAGYLVVSFDPFNLNIFTCEESYNKTMRDALTWLKWLKNGEAPFIKLIDLTRLNLMGHSLGAMTVFRVLSDTGGIKSAVTLAPADFDPRYVTWATEDTVPTSVIGGDLDKLVPWKAVMKYFNAIPETTTKSVTSIYEKNSERCKKLPWSLVWGHMLGFVNVPSLGMIELMSVGFQLLANPEDTTALTAWKALVPSVMQAERMGQLRQATVGAPMPDPTISPVTLKYVLDWLDKHGK